MNTSTLSRNDVLGMLFHDFAGFGHCQAKHVVKFNWEGISSLTKSDIDFFIEFGEFKAKDVAEKLLVKN